MNNQEYFLTTSLSYQLKAARKEMAAFRSGEAYVKLRADYENIIRGLHAMIKNFRKNAMIFPFPAKRLHDSGGMLEDIQKEHE